MLLWLSYILVNLIQKFVFYFGLNVSAQMKPLKRKLVSHHYGLEFHQGVKLQSALFLCTFKFCRRLLQVKINIIVILPKKLTFYISFLSGASINMEFVRSNFDFTLWMYGKRELCTRRL